MASVNQDAVAQALKDGHTPEEILGHLAETKKVNPDAVKQALSDGHSASDVLNFVSGASRDTSFAGAAQRGLADVARGVGSTYDVLAGNKQGTTGEGIASAVDSPNYESTPAHTGWGAAARSVLEGAPGAVGAMGLGAAASRIPVVGKYLAVPAALASIAAQYFGGNARDVAKNQGHEEPTMGDLARAAGTTGLQTAAQAIPVSRMIPGANKIVSTGVNGIGDAAWKLGKTVAAETAGNAGANAIGQVGNSVGTQKGTQLDLSQVGDAAITGAGLSAAGAGARGAVDAQSAFKYRNVTPENAPAAAALAERLQQASSGKPNKASLDAAERDIHSEIKQGASALPNLSTDAQNALARPSNLGASDLQTLKKELAGTAEGDAVMHLVQQAQMADLVRKSGRTSGDKIIGGMSSGLGRVFGALRNPAALAGAGALGTVGLAPVLAHGPLAAGGLLGLYVGARAIDAMTGARNPVARFQKRFEQPGAQVRLPGQTAPATATQAPGGPWGARPPQTVPNVPQGGPVDPAAALKEQIKAATDLMAARAANARLQKQATQSDRSNLREQIMGATQQMAARQANAAPTPVQRAQMADALQQMQARRANAPPEEAPEPVAPVVTKVSKANGKTQHTVETPPMEAALKETQPQFKPLTMEEMPHFGKGHGEVMAAKMASDPEYLKKPKAVQERITAGGIKRRAAEEAAVLKHIDEVPFAQRDALESLLEELHHTSSRRRAREVRDHYTSQLPPEVAAKVRAELSDAFINKAKPKD